jgi:hypothetical protein
MGSLNDNKEKIQFIPTEVFKGISVEGEEKLQRHYAISNFGRLVSYLDKIEDGYLIKGSIRDGFNNFRYTFRDEKDKLRYRSLFFHRLVAEYFIPKTSADQVYVLHLDGNNFNDSVNNLKWATQSEMLELRAKGANSVTSRKKLFAQGKLEGKWRGGKLTFPEIVYIKKTVLDPNSKITTRQLAKDYGVHEKSIYRIKIGENWGDIKV